MNLSYHQKNKGEITLKTYTIKNDLLTIAVNTFGAELCSIVKNETKKEYLWHGDPAFWGRRSPILFPIVGSLKNKEFIYENKSYPMNQHGFARDMEFSLLDQTDSSISFQLTSTPETLEKYPFEFELTISYELVGTKLIVSWDVHNTNKTPMYFSIGGHPAFLCPIQEGENRRDCSFEFNTKENQFEYKKVITGGLLNTESNTMKLDHGCLAIGDHLFDEDALVIENKQATKVSLLSKDHTPYLTMHFDAPLFGLWSPAKENTPFVCIEPWYGRCDAYNFDGTLKDREYGNMLDADKTFHVSYEIEIH